MATQIQFRHNNSTDTLYMVVVHESDGAHVNAADGSHDTTPTAGEWGNYDIAMAENGDSQLYQGTFPAGTAAGYYAVLVFIGAAPAVGDTLVGQTEPGSLYWDGTNLVQGRRVDVATIEGSDATDQINAAVDAALDTAIPGGPTADSINERIKTIDLVLGADVEIDTATTPWDLVYKEAGTANELLRKKLRDTAAANITAATAVIGSAKDS